jgi:pimeloyl-ACP methyl ester carboxylesterase
MDPRASRGLTPARVVALAVMTLVVAGLLYLRFAQGGDAVTVPQGAEAGDLSLEPCDFPTEDGPLAAECGTLVVPENRADPASRLIALPVIRIPARSGGASQEPVFYLEGGPGISNLDFPQVRPFAEDRDVVLVGFRGVDGSVRLDCPEVGSALARQSDFFSDASYLAYGDAFGVCARRLTAEGVDLAGYGIPQEMDDVEAARVALGYDRIDLLSQSAGTRRALIYAWKYPDRVHRSVMIGVNPPGAFLWDPAVADAQVGRYADLCAQDAPCSRRTDDLAASMARTSADMPDRWGFLPVNAGNVRLFTFYALMESTPKAAPMASTWAVDSWLAAAEGDPSGFWLQSFAGELMPIPFVWGQYAADGSLDAQAARDYFASDDLDRTNLGYVSSAFAWGGGRMADGWPMNPDVEQYRDIRRSEVETLLINGELDFSTPPQVARRDLLPWLPNGRMVELPGFGHTLTVLSEQQEAGAHLVNTFFDSGGVDTSHYRTQKLDFTPDNSLPGLAKALAGVFAGLVLAAALLLGWLTHRVRTRGGLGRRAGAVVRSLGPVVVGPAGCVAGVLLAYTLLSRVPLGGVQVVAISAGIPVGLVVHLARTHRSGPSAAQWACLAAAVGGALIGATLGFFAVEGLASFATAIVGAAVGANLFVLVLDVTRGSTARTEEADVPSASTPQSLASRSG